MGGVLGPIKYYAAQLEIRMTQTTITVNYPSNEAPFYCARITIYAIISTSQYETDFLASSGNVLFINMASLGFI